MKTNASYQLDPNRPLGILAGGGVLPVEIADSIVRRGGRVQIVSLAGEADAAFEGLPHVRVTWGQAGRMIETFKAAGVRDLVIIGAVTRPDPWTLRPDFGLIVRLPAILRLITAGGDDGVLRRVVRLFEAEGFRVLGPDEVAPELVGRAGAIGGPAATSAQRADAALGFDVVHALGRFDIGQAVVVARGKVVAIEGAEGTDRLLRRLAGRADAIGGVLIKRPKPTQELRVDLPAIGPDTVTRAAEAGLSAIMVEADRVIIALRPEMVARAVAAGVAVEGVVGREAERATDNRRMTEAQRFQPGPRLPWSEAARQRQMILDAAHGRQVLACLAQFGCGHTVVVSRRHVLAVAAGEATADVLARVGQLRQWGDGRTRARRGVLVVRAAVVAPDVIEAAAAAGLAGVQVVGMGLPGPEAIARAERAGITLLAGAA